jgi:signal transduction histidine kinase
MTPLLRSVKSKRANLLPQLCPNLPAVRMGDANFRRIIINLVTNASDAIGDQDGVIRISTSQLSVKRGSTLGENAIPENLPDGHYVMVEVSDTGRGMPRHIQQRVFDPFFSTKSLGRGVGLAVVQGIVRNANGIVQILSEPGKGAIFRVFLPYSETASERSASAGLPS